MIHQTVNQNQNSDQQSINSINTSLLQRKRACGNKVNDINEHTECSKNKRLNLQPKLKIGEPDDFYEREADRVADQVMSKQLHAEVSQTPPQISRFVDSSSRKSNLVPESVSSTLASAGRPMDVGVRKVMEQRFGYDFSQIRIHTHGNAVANSTKSLNARAYTVGENIVFAPGSYEPVSQRGQWLLAHELTHSIQQSGRQRFFHSKVSDISSIDTSLVQRDLFEDFVGLIGGDEAQRVISNLLRSIEIAPRFFLDVFAGEVLDSVLENWPEFLAVTTALLIAEGLIAVLAASPTGISQLIAGILQLIVIAVLGYFAIVETAGAVSEGMNWFRLCMEADNDEQTLEQASRAFLRMLRHVVFALLLLIGVRARVRGVGAIAEASAARARAISGRTLPSGELPPGVTRIHPRSGSPSNPGTSAGGSEASLASEGPLALARTAPVTEPTPVTTPAPIPSTPVPSSIPNIGPRASVPVTATDVLSATVAGLSSASTSLAPAQQSHPEERQEDCGPLPISWPGELPIPNIEGIILVRTNAGTREEEGIDDRGPQQRSLSRDINSARETAFMETPLEPPFRVCFGYDPGLYYDAHHVRPLFLGGGDYYHNLCGLEHNRHVAGHRRLNDQNAWINHYQNCGINSGTLTLHPQLTEYFIAGAK